MANRKPGRGDGKHARGGTKSGATPTRKGGNSTPPKTPAVAATPAPPKTPAVAATPAPPKTPVVGGSWERYRITATLRSDAHPGSGSGGGGIDALVSRDRDDRPVIWASHVEGVLRDALRRLRDDKAAQDVFGSAGGSRQRALFTSLYADKRPASHIWRSAAREAFDNRAPKDETLRVIEYVPAGTTFVGHVELPQSQVEIFRRLVQEVDALGGGRSTGSGRVNLSLECAAPPRPGNRPRAGQQPRLVLLLSNLDPVSITATATPDNLIPSLAFVPGRALLGALAAWLIAEGKSEAARSLIDGHIAVSDALPLPCKPGNLAGVEVLPAPLTLQSRKPAGSTGTLPWWALQRTPTERLDAWQAKEKLKRPDEDLFVWREDPNAAWAAFRPSRRVRLRNGRPDPQQADASLFAIEQIVERTYFRAELHGPAEAMRQLAEALAPVLARQRWLRLGRSAAPVEVVECLWRDGPEAPAVGERAILTLTSDLLVRDEWLRWRTELDQGTLGDLVGDTIQITRGDNGVLHAMQDSTMVHGFNATSQLWRMPAAAIRRGSVFAVSGPGVARLVQRAACGAWLGERTHEGFGRFRIDAALPGITPVQQIGAAPAPAADASEETIAATTRQWFADREELATSGADGDRKPSLSQWLELVAELEAGNRLFINHLLDQTNVGARGWRHARAQQILAMLQRCPDQSRAQYARMFVRWLRAAMRERARS